MIPASWPQIPLAEEGYPGTTVQLRNPGEFHTWRCCCFDMALQKLHLKLVRLFWNTLEPNYFSR